MGKAGRKRREGVRRHPSGQIAETRDKAERAREGEQLRMATLLTRARHARLDPMAAASQQAESLEGRLFLRGILSEPEADAIHMYRLVRKRYVLGIAAPHYVRASGDRVDGTRAHLITDEEAEVSKTQYIKAKAVLEGAGRPAYDAIQSLVIFDIIPLQANWPHVQAGAAALVDHFGLAGPLSSYYEQVPRRKMLRALL